MPQKKKTPQRRKRITASVEKAVLVSCRRRCALCFYLDGDDSAKLQGQIAHIDRNRDNNSEANLAYLCLCHHDTYDGRTSQSKRLMPGELYSAKQMLLEYLGLHGKRGIVEATVTIQVDFAEFTDSDRDAFMASLVQLVKHKENVSVTKVTRGSVKIDLCMDAEDVAMLMREVRRGRLQHLRVSSIVPKTSVHGHNYSFVEPFKVISHFSQLNTIRIFEESPYVADVPSADPTARLRACCRPSPVDSSIATIVLACISAGSIILTPPLVVKESEVDEWCCDRPMDLLQGFLAKHGVVIGQAGYPDTKLILNRQVNVSAFARNMLTLSGYLEHMLSIKEENARVILIVRAPGNAVYILVAYSLSVQEQVKQGKLAKEVAWFR